MTDWFDEDDALAAEFALGVLDQQARLAVQARLPGDRRLAGLVDDWNRRVAALADSVPEVTPPAAVWWNIASATLPPRDAARRAARQPRKAFYHAIGFWRWWSLGTSALAAVLALYIVFTPLGPAPPPTRYIAMLDTDATGPAWMVTVDVAAGRMTIKPLTEIASGERSLELWLVADDATPPRSLGLLDPAVEVSLTLSPEIRAATKAATLAVSLEPPGGSPSGAPTGPVVYQGAVMAIEN